MPKRPNSELVHLALPFGGTRYDQVRVLMGYQDSIKSVDQLVEHFKDAGRIDSYENRQRVVHMDELNFPLGNILVTHDNYEQLVLRASGNNQKSEGYRLLSIVRYEADHSPSSKGKARYLCEASQGVFDGGRAFDVRPVLVVEPDIAPMVQELLEWGHDTFLVAARPYTKGFSDPNDPATQIFLHVARMEQIKQISPDHWDRPNLEVSGQLTLAPHMGA